MGYSLYFQNETVLRTFDDGTWLQEAVTPDDARYDEYVLQISRGITRSFVVNERLRRSFSLPRVIERFALTSEDPFGYNIGGEQEIETLQNSINSYFKHLNSILLSGGEMTDEQLWVVTILNLHIRGIETVAKELYRNGSPYLESLPLPTLWDIFNISPVKNSDTFVLSYEYRFTIAQELYRRFQSPEYDVAIEEVNHIRSLTESNSFYRKFKEIWEGSPDLPFSWYEKLIAD